MTRLQTLGAEAKEHLLSVIIPFWMSKRDAEFGGFYGFMDYDLSVDRQAVKGCILNSRITWFFSNVVLLYKDGFITDEDCTAHGYGIEDIKLCAQTAYDFMRTKCVDHSNGGVYWSVTYDGKPSDTTKHTYNQAFSIYALSSYYDAFRDENALNLAKRIFDIIESKCTDEIGYLEAFTKEFGPESNEKLSENGVMADKTMNTLLHVFEAYTEMYRVCKYEPAKTRICWILDTIASRIYNPALHRQDVFFDANYKSIIDLHSYGHDIETAWLTDRGLEVLDDEIFTMKMSAIPRNLVANVLKLAFDGHSLANECENGVVNEDRIWWVQAECVVGLLNAYQKQSFRKDYFTAALAQWEFIKEYVHDKREGSEWYWKVDKEGKPFEGKPIIEEWKCPYHNGRMCMEVIRRVAAMEKDDQYLLNTEEVTAEAAGEITAETTEEAEAAGEIMAETTEEVVAAEETTAETAEEAVAAEETPEAVPAEEATAEAAEEVSAEQETSATEGNEAEAAVLEESALEETAVE